MWSFIFKGKNSKWYRLTGNHIIIIYGHVLQLYNLTVGKKWKTVQKICGWICLGNLETYSGSCS